MSAKTEYEIAEATVIMGIVWAIMELARRQNRHSEENIRSLLNLPIAAKRTIRQHLRTLTNWGVVRKSKPPKTSYGRGRNTYFLVDLYHLPEHVWKVQASRTTVYRYKQKAVEDGWLYRVGQRNYFLDGKNIMWQPDCAKLIKQSLKEGLQKEGKARGLRDYEIDKVIRRLTDEDNLISGLNAVSIDIDPNFLEWFHDYLIWKFHFEYTGVALS